MALLGAKIEVSGRNAQACDVAAEIKIRANAIASVPVKTDFALALWDDNPTTLTTATENCPLRRIGLPDDMAVPRYPWHLPRQPS